MTLVDEEPGARRPPPDGLPPLPSGRRQFVWLLVLALTVAAVVALFLWLPGASASAPGGCGGG